MEDAGRQGIEFILLTGMIVSGVSHGQGGQQASGKDEIAASGKR